MQGISSSVSSWASTLFSKLDTKSQGFIEKSDLQSAFSSLTSTSGSSSSTSVDDIFSALDSDSNGKVTESELSTTLTKIASELDNQFNQMRMQGFGGHGGHGGGMSGMGGMGGMPPPPQGGQDTGFTKDELSAQLQEMGTSDSKRSDLINSIVNNFDKADTDGDGKVTGKEAMAYDQSTKGTSATSSSGTSNTSTGTSASESDLAQLLAALGGMSGTHGANGMPPPPPPGGDQGFSKDQLTSQLQEIGSTDSKRASLLSSLLENFNTADADDDGKITGKEAKTFEKSQSSTATGSTTSATSTAANSEISVMLKMVQLMQAYGINNQSSSTTSVSA